jgi:hypothetical protein
MESAFRNTTRWRTHELILVTLLVIFGIAGNFWPIFEHPSLELNDWWGREFKDLNVPFSYNTNVLLPRCWTLLVLYGGYLWINFFVVPRFSRVNLTKGVVIEGEQGKALKKALWALATTILLIVLTGIAVGSARTYTNAGFEASGITDAMMVGMGMRQVTDWVIGFLIYALIRERAIRRMQEDVLLHASQISIVNQVSGFLLAYFAIGSAIENFNVIDGPPSFHDFYFFFFPQWFLSAITNLYWVFPLKGDGKFWRWPLVKRLLIANSCWGIPFVYYGISDARDLPAVYFSLWAVNMLVVVPISWLIFRQWKDKILQMRGLETALGQSEADLQFLKAQINPHFLFNALNTLYGTALQEDAGRTAEGVQRLGDMMRFMLHENHLQRIPMSKEIDYLKNYIALQELRTKASESIHIETNIDEACEDFSIAPMLLIPFVENAFKHGISLREPSWIRIRLNCEGKRVQYEIRNSIHAKREGDPEKDRSGIGLKNVLHRLKLLYPDKHEFYMHQDEKEFFIQLTIQP